MSARSRDADAALAGTNVYRSVELRRGFAAAGALSGKRGGPQQLDCRMFRTRGLSIRRFCDALVTEPAEQESESEIRPEVYKREGWASS